MVAKTPNTELIDYQFKVMNDRIDSYQEYTKWEFYSLRKETKEGNQALHEKLDKFIEAANDKFATKEEHEANKIAIEEIRSAHSKIAWSAISFIWATIIGFATFVLKKLWIL